MDLDKSSLGIDIWYDDDGRENAENNDPDEDVLPVLSSDNESDIPVFSSPAQAHAHSALGGNENTPLHYLLAFDDLSTYFVVGIPVQSFLDTYFPVTATTETELSDSEPYRERPTDVEPWESSPASLLGAEVFDNADVTQPTNRSGRAEATFLNSYAGVFEHLKLYDTHKHPDTLGWGGAKADLSVYTISGAQQSKALGGKADSGEYRFNPLVCELFIECKPIKWEPFTFGKEQRSRAARREPLGQMGHYTTKIMASQHRTHLYLVLSFPGHRFRLFRWDSAGVVVTRLETGTALLTNFFRRFDRALPVARGLDPTVHWATYTEKVIFLRELDSYGRDRLELNNDDLKKFKEKHYEDGHVAVMKVANQYILVSRPTCIPSRPVGRRTRGYFGVQAKPGQDGKHQVGYVKETWLLCRTSNNRAVEGDLIQTLHKRGLLNMPEHVVHGYVSNDPESFGHTTKTDQQVDKYGVFDFKYSKLARSAGKRIPQPHRHYRLFTTLFGHPLTEFRDGEELVNVIGDSLLCIIDAYQKNRLHRDISMGNIILLHKSGSRNRMGALIDWEYSCDDQGHEADGGIRTGTPVFMSAMMLRSKTEEYRHEVFDDIESLSYVFLLMCIQWMAVNETSEERLKEARDMLFDPSNTGRGKRHHLRDVDVDELVEFRSPAIQRVWIALFEFTSGIYRWRRSSGKVDQTDADSLEAVRTEIRKLDLVKLVKSRQAGEYDIEAAPDGTTLAALIKAFEYARVGTWDTSADRLATAQVEVMHRGAFCGPLNSNIWATLASEPTTETTESAPTTSDPTGLVSSNGDETTLDDEAESSMATSATSASASSHASMIHGLSQQPQASSADFNAAPETPRFNNARAEVSAKGLVDDSSPHVHSASSSKRRSSSAVTQGPPKRSKENVVGESG